MNPRIVVALLLVGVFALGAIVLAASGRDSDEGSPNTFEGALLPEGFRAPDFRLRNQDGDPVSMRSLRGRPVVVTFLYTTCQDSCPIQAQTVRGALDDLGHDVPALAIAVDPPNDTPQSARRRFSRSSGPRGASTSCSARAPSCDRSGRGSRSGRNP